MSENETQVELVIDSVDPEVVKTIKDSVTGVQIIQGEVSRADPVTTFVIVGTSIAIINNLLSIAKTGTEISEIVKKYSVAVRNIFGKTVPLKGS